MTWIRFEDTYPESPKIIGLTDSAFRVWHLSVACAARSMSDGRLSRQALRGILYRYPKSRARIVAELVAAGLWDKVSGEEGVYNIHDYRDFQLTKDQIIRAREAARMRAQRFRNVHSNAVTVPVSHTTPSHPIVLVQRVLQEGGLGGDAGGNGNAVTRPPEPAPSGHATRPTPAHPRFTPPSVAEVRAYVEAQHLRGVDPLRFVAFYEGNGWKVGRNPMRNWRAAAVSWSRRD